MTTTTIQGYHCFESYDSQLGGRSSRKLANNTYAVRDGEDVIHIHYHATDVVTYHRDGRTVLNSGGWLTYTTKDRFNNFSPARVWSDRGQWFVKYGGVEYAYDDGITLHPDGTVTGALTADETKERAKTRNRVNRKIRAFVNSITPEQIIERFENTAGDCWGCKSALQDESISLGQDCLASHVAEHYFHGSLAYRAIKARGYARPDIIMRMIYGEAQRGKVSDLLTDSLSKFLRKRLATGEGRWDDL